MTRLKKAIMNLRPALAAAMLWLSLAGLTGTATAQDLQRIAAVVNDEVISGFDLEQRLALIVSSTGVDASGEAGKRLRQQVLRTLIDEKLQLQEAREFDVIPDPQEVEETIQSVAEQNRMSIDDLGETLRKSGVNLDALRQQIRAEIAWSDLVRRRFMSRIAPGDEQVDAVMARMEANAGRPEYQVSEIFLSVESPDDEEEVRRSAMRLVEQLRRGAAFRGVARQFSQAATAAVGGDLGWVQEGQLSEELDRELARLSIGDISDPIRTIGGYYILNLQDRRTATGGGLSGVVMEMRQFMVPYTSGILTPIPNPQLSDERVANAVTKATQIATNINSCTDVEALQEEYGREIMADGGSILLAEVPPLFRATAEVAELNVPSEPILSPQGAHVLIVCERSMHESSVPTRDVIEARLNQETLALRARRYLRDLRREAVVEFR